MRFFFTLLLLGLIALLGRVPLTQPTEGAMVRLAWRHLGARAEVRLTQEELEKLPFHMRPQEGVTETRFLPYQLKVSLNNEPVLDRLVTPGGLHGDRPLAVFESLPVEPGPVRVKIHFSAVGEGESLEMDKTCTLAPGQVLLIQLQDDGFTVLGG